MYTNTTEALTPDRLIDILTGPQFDRRRHGGLYDRGSADSYYNRPASPHWYPEGTGHGTQVTDLTERERAEYMLGYRDNERSGNHKEWD